MEVSDASRIRRRVARKRISSQMTFFTKRAFPVIWFGFLGVWTAGASFGIASSDVPPWILVAPCVMAVIGYLVMRHLVFDLADEVFDEGDSLLVRKGRITDRVKLADITNVSYSAFTSPRRVTLSLRRRSKLGNEVTFAPLTTLSPFSRHPTVVDLIDRIDATRVRRA